MIKHGLTAHKLSNYLDEIAFTNPYNIGNVAAMFCDAWEEFRIQHFLNNKLLLKHFSQFFHVNTLSLKENKGCLLKINLEIRFI